MIENNLTTFIYYLLYDPLIQQNSNKHVIFKALLTFDIRLLWQPKTALFPPAAEGGHQRLIQLRSQSSG